MQIYQLFPYPDLTKGEKPGSDDKGHRFILDSSGLLHRWQN
jgi:hypothetical protein